MKRIQWLFIFLLPVLAGCSAGSAGSDNGSNLTNNDNPLTIPDSGPNSYDPGGSYVLVWADEFEGPDIDTSTWSYETAATGWSQSWNNEWQLYTDNGTGGENAFVQDGVLVVQANMNGSVHRQSAYTSARMVTKGNESWNEGKIAVRMALPFGQGIWPAVWMLGTNEGTVGWPACGEIDIMEMVGGGTGDHEVHGTLHWDDGGHAYSGNSTTLTDPRNFHIYELEWTDQVIRIGVDGTVYHTVDIAPAALSEFHQEFYLIINLAVGGNWGGYPDSTTVFPQFLLIDWIRVYQIP